MAKLGFTGIGVSNLKKSSDFYQKVLDLEEKGTYENVEVDLQDGSSFCIDEIVLCWVIVLPTLEMILVLAKP